MKRYLLRQEKTSARFVECSWTDSGDVTFAVIDLDARAGKLERIQGEQTFSAAEGEQNLWMAQRHKFQECDQATWGVALRESEQRLRLLCNDSLETDCRLVPWSDLNESLGHYFQNDPAEYLHAPLDKFCVFEQPAAFSDGLVLGFNELAASPQTRQRNLVFEQGLKITGNIDAGRGTSSVPLFVLVIGDLHVDNLILTCWAEVVVTGNLIATGVVFGYDGETGGRLKVHGNLQAARILGGGMYPMHVDGAVSSEVYWLDDDEPSLADAVTVPTELSEQEWSNRAELTALRDQVYYADSTWGTGSEIRTYSFNSDILITELQKKQPVFR